jgi:cytoskeletal protein CcmA (bactofilin family)
MAGALISEELEIVGDLICEGSVDVRGTIRGDVAAGKLAILSGGQLNGEVKADEMVVHGDYSGNVTCATMLIHSEATVRSDIIAKQLSCESGADVEGRFKVDGGPAGK